MVMAIDWSTDAAKTPREQYEAAAAVIDEAKAAAGRRRAQIAHDLAVDVGAKEAAQVLGITPTRVYALAARHRAAGEEIASQIHGHTIHSYDLLDDAQEFIADRREAHDAIHALLADLVNLDGEDHVILARRPVDPALKTANPMDRDVYYWLTISADAARAIRETLAASYGNRLR